MVPVARTCIICIEMVWPATTGMIPDDPSIDTIAIFPAAPTVSARNVGRLVSTLLKTAVFDGVMAAKPEAMSLIPVSYTHLTLPTIYSV